MSEALERIKTLIEAGEVDTAKTELEVARQAGCPPYSYWMLLAAWHMRQRIWHGAIPPLNKAMELFPYDHLIHYNLGFCYHRMDDFALARQSYETALRLNPGHAESWARLGHVLILTDNFPLSLASYTQGALQGPNSADARCCYGTGLAVFGDDEHAEIEYRAALDLRPCDVETEMSLGFTLLRAGKWKEGWDRRQATLKHIPFMMPWNFKPPPMWYGDLHELTGKRVLLRSEQGYGDSIQFARYVPLVAKRAAKVWLLVEPPLRRLMQGLGAEVIMPGDPVEADIDTTLMSLPGVFGTRPDYCPPPAHYHVQARPSDARIGLCWHGNARTHDPTANRDDRLRSIPEEMFAPLSKLEPCLSLQEEHLQEWGCKDWYDTAELVKGLDLVITVDTAMAHLAGSLGKETWLLGRKAGCWRWLETGNRTNWYPSMKIYRQSHLCEWKPVMDQVLHDLKGWIYAREHKV